MAVVAPLLLVSWFLWHDSSRVERESRSFQLLVCFCIPTDQYMGLLLSLECVLRSVPLSRSGHWIGHMLGWMWYFPGMYRTVGWYFCSLMRSCWILGGAWDRGFVMIASRGLWSLCTIISFPYTNWLYLSQAYTIASNSFSI